MGKARCAENKELTRAIKLFKKHADELRKAEKSAEDGQVEKLFLSGVVACKEAIVKLVRMQGRHQKMCEECLKGK